MPQDGQSLGPSITGEVDGGIDRATGLYHVFSTDSTGALKVISSGGGSNAAAGLTGQAVPTSADYQGVNISGNLTGVTGLALGATTKAPTVAIVDGNGNQITSFGGGTQFADNAASGATPTGTLVMGWDSVNSKIRALKVDASQNLLVSWANAQHVIVDSGAITVSGTVTANQGTAAALSGKWPVIVTDGTNTMPTGDASARTIHVTIDNATVAVSGTVTANQGGAPWTVIGTQSDNSADSTAKLPTIPAKANAAFPNWTEGNQVPLSVDLTGNLRTSIPALSTTNTLNSGSGAGSTVMVSLLGQGSAGFTLAAGTLAATLIPELSSDGGNNWIATFFDEADTNQKIGSINVTNPNPVIIRSIVTAGGCTNVRVRVSSFTSGSASATISATTAANPSTLYENAAGVATAPGWVQVAGGDGVNTIPTRMKNASTAAVAADPSLVVALSPNSPLPAGTAVIGHVIVDSGSITVSGTVTANQGTANATPWNENVAQFGGNVVVTGTGVSGLGIPRVTVSSDSFPAIQAVSGTVTSNQGTASALSKWSVQVDSPLNQQLTAINVVEAYGSPLAEILNTILYELRATRLATVANTCDGGRYKESDFDPALFDQRI